LLLSRGKIAHFDTCIYKQLGNIYSFFGGPVKCGLECECTELEQALPLQIARSLKNSFVCKHRREANFKLQ